MTTTMIRSLEAILLGLLVLVVVAVEAWIRPGLPDRPFSLMIWLPAGLLWAGAMFFPEKNFYPGSFQTAVVGMKVSSLFVCALAPFFVWHFPFYHRVYFVICGVGFLLSLQLFLIFLAQVLEYGFIQSGQWWVARLSRFTGISITPLMGAMTVIVYLHTLNFGASAWVAVIESPYSVWLRVSLLVRGLFFIPFLMIVVLLFSLILTVPSRTVPEIAG